jgi:apolipoprotein N-acyltransferase
VDSFADIHPERIILRGYGGETIRQELVVTPKAAYPFKVTAVSAKDGIHIQYELREQKTPQGRSFIVTVKNTKDSPGKYYDTLFLSTDSPLKPRIPIHVYGTIGAGPAKETPPS